MIEPTLADIRWLPRAAFPPQPDSIRSVAFDPPDASIVLQSFGEILAARAAQTPDAIALHEPGRNLTFARLWQMVRRLAVCIAEAVPQGSTVGIMAPSGLDFAVGILACSVAHRIGLIINSDLPAERVIAILRHGMAGGLVSPEGSGPANLPADIVHIPLELATSVGPDDVSGFGRAGPDDIVLVVYTSGSSGQPKGIARCYRELIFQGLNRILLLHLNPGDRVMTLFPMSSGVGLKAFVMAMMAGASTCLAKLPVVGTHGALDIIRSERITVLQALPTLFSVLCAAPNAPEAMATLRAFCTTSEPVLRADVETWRRAVSDGCALLLAYGMTEASPLCEWFAPDPLPTGPARLPVGYLNPACDFAMVDEGGGAAAQGEPGVLWVRGNPLSLGEWQDGQCVLGRLLVDPHDADYRVFRTGDVVQQRADGLIQFIGRADAQVKLRGNRIEPAEVEDALRRATGVVEATVLARRTGDEVVLVAFAVVAGDASRDGLMTRLREVLPGYMVPSRLWVLERLPRLPGGKLDTRALATHDDEATSQPGVLGRLLRPFARTGGRS